MTLLRLCDQQSATVPPESSAAEAIRLMLARRVGAVMVVDGNRLPANQSRRRLGFDAGAPFPPLAGGGRLGQAAGRPLDPQSAAWADGGTQAAARFSGTLCRQRGAGGAQG
jgi:CBS domain-containing protein